MQNSRGGGVLPALAVFGNIFTSQSNERSLDIKGLNARNSKVLTF